MPQPSYHLELRTTSGKFLADMAVENADHAAHAMRHLAKVSPGAYGPNGSHRLVLVGPDHAFLSRSVDTTRGI